MLTFISRAVVFLGLFLGALPSLSQDFRLALPNSSLDPMTLVRAIDASEEGKESLRIIEYNMLKTTEDGRRVNQYYRGSLVRIRNDKRQHEFNAEDWNDPSQFLVVELVIDENGRVKFHRPGASNRWDWIVESFDFSKTEASFDPSIQAQLPAEQTSRTESAADRFQRHIQYYKQGEQIIQGLRERFLEARGGLEDRVLESLDWLKQETRRDPGAASRVLQVLSLYGESRSDSNLAHRAAILSSMKNRRLKPEFLAEGLWPYLQDLGPWLKGRTGRSTILDEAYQVWNPDNPNLAQMFEADIQSDQALQSCLSFVTAFEAGRIQTDSPETLNSVLVYDHTDAQGRTPFDDLPGYQRILDTFQVWIEDLEGQRDSFDHSDIRIYRYNS